MSWELEQKRKIYEDYRDGKINYEKFQELNKTLESETSPVAHNRQYNISKRTLLVTAAATIVAIACISGYLYYRSTPQYQAQQFIEVMGAVQKETDKINNNTKAVNISSGMRYMKAAVLIYLADNSEKMTKESLPSLRMEELSKYLNNQVPHEDLDKYKIIKVGDTYFVQFDTQGLPQESKLALEEMNNSAQTSVLVNEKGLDPYRANDRYICLILL